MNAQFAANHAADAVALDAARAWELLESIPDPEIPVVSIRELGILREINASAHGVEVVVTPTYSGCPAISQIEDDILATLAEHGINATIRTQLAPAWSTDWISASARDKLRTYGIAPPHAQAATHNVIQFAAKRAATRMEQPVPCPHCGSQDTTETSHFGSTSCKALYKCLACLEPFDYFKPY